jgi:hypothetical protein
MQKVWMVWQTVDFGQDWMMGVFSTEAKAEAATADMFAEWLDDRGMTADTFNGDNPFDVSETKVQ